MKYRGMHFLAPMVRAILEGRKTQTRMVILQPLEALSLRMVRPWPTAASIHPDGSGLGWIAWWPSPVSAEETARIYPGNEGFRCLHGVPGDRLYVKETFFEGDDGVSNI